MKFRLTFRNVGTGPGSDPEYKYYRAYTVGGVSCSIYQEFGHRVAYDTGIPERYFIRWNWLVRSNYGQSILAHGPADTVEDAVKLIKARLPGLWSKCRETIEESLC